jgi:hypothetical protein
MHLPRLGFRIALLATLALPLGCMNPFKPANPEPPAAGSIAEDYRIPDSVLSTMAAAIRSRTESGVNAWVHAFADSQQAGDLAYRQFYDGGVKLSWQSANNLPAPEPWTLEFERGLPTFLFGIRQNASYEFVWTHDPGSPNDDPFTADTVQIHRKYQLLASTSTSADTEIIVSGFADLSLQNKSSRWSIFRWNDRVDPDFGVNPPNSEFSMSRRRLDSRFSNH